MGLGASLDFQAKDLSGQVAIVTGSNSGTGYETAKALAGMGAKVVMACRSASKAEQAIRRMKEEVGEGGVEMDLSFAPLDLSSLKSTVSFADSFLAGHDKLDILCCNAGYYPERFELTADGFESGFQTNYLGHFLLIVRLLPWLRKSDSGPRVASVTSVMHAYGKLDLARTNQPSGFGYATTYGTTKLLQVLMTGALVRRLDEAGVGVASVHPGTVNSEFYTDAGWILGATRFMGSWLGMFRTPAQGAATIIKACVEKLPADGTQIYFSDCRATQPAAIALNRDNQEAVFDYSVRLLKDLITPEGAQILGIDLSRVARPEFGHPIPENER